MAIGSFVSIIGALGVVHGIAFIVAPDQVATAYGLQPTVAIELMARLFGGALIAWGAILWSAKNFRDEAAVRAVLLSTAVAEAISLVFVVQATLAGTMNAMGWVATLIYAFGSAGCVYFLTGQKRLVVPS
jgi:hypothetical protein